MRLEEKFEELKKEGRKAFNVYFPFGFPELAYTPDILFALQSAGVDIIELGFPFSDSLADGPIIQRASSVSLQQKITMDTFFKTIRKIRKDIKIPIAAMSYYNPVFRYGINNFFKGLAESGISGSILVDLPLEESSQYLDYAKKYNINPILFMTPATPADRMQEIAKAARGFIYYISVTGITGPRKLNFQDIALHIKKIKKITDVPVCVGFGIHNKKQVEAISSLADGVILGSEIVKYIDKNYKKKSFLKGLEKKIKGLRA